MKILILLNRLGRGGAQRLVLDICEEFNHRKNVQYKLVVFDTLHLYKEYDNIVTREICNSFVNVSILKKNKIDVSCLQNIIDEFKPNVIHSHLFMPELISRSSYCPEAVWFSHMHDNMPQIKRFTLKTFFNKKLFLNYIERSYLFKRFKINGGNNFIAISKDAYEYAILNAPKFKTSLLHNAINTKKFQCKNINFKKRDNVIKIINISSFQPKKNQELLVNIGAELFKRNKDFEIHFLGDGKTQNQIEKLVEQKNIKDKVFFHGMVQHVEKELCKADIYVHTAHYEPFGLVLLEAMATGLPVITLDGKGNRDLIEEGENGYMIYEKKPTLFADKILELSSDNEKYDRISNYAKEFSNKYDIVNYVDNLLSIYQNAIDLKAN